MEFVQRNGFHLIIDKTRRGGFSYIMARLANDINRKVDSVAADKKYLTQLEVLLILIIIRLKLKLLLLEVFQQ